MCKMLSSLYSLCQPLIFKLNPEIAHNIGLLGIDFLGFFDSVLHSCEKQKNFKLVFGLRFPNVVGLAAGFDKDAAHVRGINFLGFGFVEVGTVTPKPQAGNEKPRLFRLKKSKAIINRMGFNNLGVGVLVQNLKKLRNLELQKYGDDYEENRSIVGVNIGKNKWVEEEKAVDDYLFCFEKVWDIASYIVINVSSPNTPGLRNLQSAEPLKKLLLSLKTRQMELNSLTQKWRPLLLKISPDLSESQVLDVVNVVNDIGIDGVIATNSTLDRSSVLQEIYANEAGGLTGAPLFKVSLAMVKTLRKSLDPKIAIIGCGGIFSKEQATSMLEAGADLIQLYTSLIYNGPAFVKQLAFDLG